MMGRAWTTKKAERVWQRLRAGVSVTTIAADMGCTVTNVHRRLRAAGYDPAGERRLDVDEDAKIVYEGRKAGKEFTEIATDLGMEPSRANVRCLYMRLVRYCERHELTYPRLRRKKKAASLLAVTPTMVTDAILAIKRRMKRGEQTDMLDLEDELKLPNRLVKRIVAEMRRRRLVADGLVPAKVEADPGLTGCEQAIIKAVRAAWADEKRSCESLNTLPAAIGYAHSTINIAIVKLRQLGLIEPRGFLYLRV